MNIIKMPLQKCQYNHNINSPPQKKNKKNNAYYDCLLKLCPFSSLVGMLMSMAFTSFSIITVLKNFWGIL